MCNPVIKVGAIIFVVAVLAPYCAAIFLPELFSSAAKVFNLFSFEIKAGLAQKFMAHMEHTWGSHMLDLSFVPG